MGILDPKRSLLEGWRTLAVCWKLYKTTFFYKSHTVNLPAVCRVLGKVRELHPQEAGPVAKPTTAVLTATLCYRSNSGAFCSRKTWKTHH